MKPFGLFRFSISVTSNRFEISLYYKLYETGEIGEIFNIESRVHGSRGIPSDRRGIKKYGGMIYDWGIHLIDQILQIVPSKIDTVFCRLDYIINDEVDDGSKLELMFENGCRAYIELGTYNFIPCSASICNA